MKSILTIIAFTLFFPLHTFSQVRNYKETIPERLTAERLREIQKSNHDDLQRLNDKESFLLKSKNSNWQMPLRDPHRDFYEQCGFNTNDSRTTINKTQLENGFLSVEQINQRWNGSAWVNNLKYSDIYDGNNNKIESIYQNWSNSAWVNEFKRSYTYNENNNPTGGLFQVWDGSVWVNSGKISYTYDGVNKTEELRLRWYNYVWENSEIFSYIYDSKNNNTEEIRQEWDGSVWVNYWKDLYTYNESNNKTEYVNQFWDDFDTIWVNNWKDSYTYDGNNNLAQKVAQDWYLNDSVWVNTYKESYTYDGNNNLIEYLVQVWDSQVWVNNFIELSTYDGNTNLTQKISQNWDDSVWVNYFRYSYTYDGNHNLTEGLDQYWDSFVWVNQQNYLSLYDGDNNLIEKIQKIWNRASSTWENEDKDSYSYVPITSVNEDLNSVNFYRLSNNYPNPFNPSTSIQYAISNRQFVSLKVYDILGTEIETLVNEEKSAGKYELNWNAANLPSGVYFYRLQAGDFVQTRKMILLK